MVWTFDVAAAVENLKDIRGCVNTRGLLLEERLGAGAAHVPIRYLIIEWVEAYARLMQASATLLSEAEKLCCWNMKKRYSVANRAIRLANKMETLRGHYDSRNLDHLYIYADPGIRPPPMTAHAAASIIHRVSSPTHDRLG